MAMSPFIKLSSFLLRTRYANLRNLYAELRWCQLRWRRELVMAGPGAAETEMPATVAAAWGVRERSQKGPKPALSLARIVDAGVRVADSEGLDAVSMGLVAASLDTAPMSLYRHVSSKDELVRLMVDAAWGDSPGPALAGEGWRTGLSRWAWGFRAALRRHPWAGRIPISGL